MTDTRPMTDMRSYTQAELDAMSPEDAAEHAIACLSRLDTVQRGLAKHDPVDVIARNVVTNHPCKVVLNQLLGKLAGHNLESRKSMLGELISRTVAIP